MKEIKLTQGKVTLVDDEDFEWLNQWKWHAVKQTTENFYAVRQLPRGKNGKRKICWLHRLILGLTNPKVFIDHRDRNGLNNQRRNLREATQSQNSANILSKKNSKSKYLGVDFHLKNNNWRARIQKKDHQIYLGSFKNQEDAALAYNKKAIELHGEFANLNKL